MTTRAVASLLRWAWLLAAALGVITGLLGMHVLTPGHASHGAVSPAGHATAGHAAAGHATALHATAGHTAVAQSPVGGHAGHVDHAPAASALDMPGIAAACGDSCPGAQESGAPCIPSAPSGPVTIFPPHATLAVVPLQPAAAKARAGYGYLPPSPTPCDLSISRT